MEMSGSASGHVWLTHLCYFKGIRINNGRFNWLIEIDIGSENNYLFID